MLWRKKEVKTKVKRGHSKKKKIFFLEAGVGECHILVAKRVVQNEV